MIGRPLQSAAHPRGGRRWIRVLWPSFLIVIWVIGAALGGPYFGRIDEVSSNEQANYLPASAEATKVQQLRGEFSESNAIPAIVVFTSEQVLSEAQLEEIAAQITGLPAVAGVAEEVSPAIPSDDGRAVQVFVPIEPDAEIGNVVAELSRGLQDRVPEGVQVHVTGPAGFTADLLRGLHRNRRSPARRGAGRGVPHPDRGLSLRAASACGSFHQLVRVMCGTPVRVVAC